MKTVRLPLRIAQWLRSLVMSEAEARPADPEIQEALRALEAATRLPPRRAPKPEVARAKKAKAQKRQTKKELTREIRSVVFERSLSKCELCLEREATDLHHAFGRVRQRQDVSNTLAACRPCHRALTVSRPSAEHWLELQAQVFERLGHHATARTLRNRLESREVIGSLRVSR